MNDNVEIMAAIERAVADTFLKRFGGKKMCWERARELVVLEQQLVENIAFELEAAFVPVVDDEKRIG